MSKLVDREFLDGLNRRWHEGEEGTEAPAPDEASACPRCEALREALTPSLETKAAYMGEFSVPYPIVDEKGDPFTLQINVPWTTIKEIMAAIRAHAEGKP